ncbi:MAG: iron uptake porin [Cyanobacteria bacterium J06600_6]
MNRLFLQAAKVAPVLFAASLFSASGASAQTITAEKGAVNQTLEQINNYQDLKQGSQSQVTNVNQLRDVSPTDWAYEALRSLVDRYGCISGFPNQTYRGNQPLSRYEFAAGLNSCLNQIERLIASNTGGVDPADLETIERITQEFEAELATLGGRVDEIESRTAVIEDSQFSTTTKLKGEAVFAIADAFGDFADGIEDSDVEIEDETTFSSRIRLNFDTSFFGKDRLRTRLAGGNITRYDDGLTGTDSTRLGFDSNNGFNIEVADLHYRFPLNDKVRVWVGPFGLDLDDIFDDGNPVLSSGSTGALSRFNRRNPLVFRGVEGAGAGVNIDIIEDKLALNALYLTDDADSPAPGEGLFNGSFNAGAQLEFTPFDAVGLSATYVRSYQTSDESGSLSGSTVDGNASNPFNPGIATTANKIGVGANVKLGEKIVLAGFGGYADVEGLVPGENPDGEVWTWGANASVLDLVKEGSVLAIAGGMLPKFISDRDTVEATFGADEDPDTSYIVEALYKFPLNDNITITPGAYAVFNPNQIEENDTIYVGVVRTTLKF